MFSGLLVRGWFDSLGRFSLIEVTTTGIVIRKMISSTSITSTRGVMLICELASLTPREPPTLMPIWFSSRGCRRGQKHGAQLRPECCHVVQCARVATDQPVVAKHGRHGHRQPEGGHDQSFADRTGHLVDACLAGDSNRRERIEDAPDRAEQTDERTGR